jgi:hypothetical protein
MKNLLILMAFICLVACTSAPRPSKPQIAPIEPSISKEFYTVSTKKEFAVNSAKIANCVTALPQYHSKILAEEYYSHFTGKNSEIVESLLSDKKAIIKTYFKRFTKAKAYRIPGQSEIYINMAKISPNTESIIVTLIHERLHVLGYSHRGNNRNKYNNINSVPYKASMLSKGFLSYCVDNQ